MATLHSLHTKNSLKKLNHFINKNMFSKLRNEFNYYELVFILANKKHCTSSGVISLLTGGLYIKNHKKMFRRTEMKCKVLAILN